MRRSRARHRCHRPVAWIISHPIAASNGTSQLKKHLMEAATRGNAEAQFNLAMMCENGAADSRYTKEGNHSEAMRWLLAAATQGLPRAQIKLAEFHALDAETPEGSVKAWGWYLIAIT